MEAIGFLTEQRVREERWVVRSHMCAVISTVLEEQEQEPRLQGLGAKGTS